MNYGDTILNYSRDVRVKYRVPVSRPVSPYLARISPTRAADDLPRSSRGKILAGEGPADQHGRLAHAVERRERAEARSLALAEQDFVERAEPVAQIVERVRLADGVDLQGLQLVCRYPTPLLSQ